MTNFSFLAKFLTITEKIKPVLIKVLPIELLRGAKRALVGLAMKRSGKYTFLPFSRDANPDGVNLIGYVRGEIGLGQSCRLLAHELEHSGIEFTIYNYEQVSAIRQKDRSWDHKITNTAPYNINLIHINPYELPLAFLQLGRNVWDNRYNIVFWLWELEKFPAEWEESLNLADEVWTPSEFASESIRKVTSKPVHTIPYALTAPADNRYGREFFALPVDQYLFLCMYDCNSAMERKNPMGAIRAFKKAVSAEDQGAGLVIKINNPQQKDIDMIKRELEGYPNIYLITEVLEKIQVNSLIACCDTYVTLHRSEGFGLVPAEAMLLGTPVIATNWSSNTEFMDSGCACMVDYVFTTIEKTVGPYAKGNRWADPDIAQAADMMRKLRQDKEFRQSLALRAKSHIMEALSLDRASALIQLRIGEIYARANSEPPGHPEK